jgi:hypothetical protein
VIIPRICPLCAFIHLAPNQKNWPQNPPTLCPNSPNSRCQKNSCKVANQRRNKEKLKPSIILISSHHILGFGKPKATTLFHTLFQISMKKIKNDKLFISLLMNINIKLGEKKKLER